MTYCFNYTHQKKICQIKNNLFFDLTAIKTFWIQFFKKKIRICWIKLELAVGKKGKKGVDVNPKHAPVASHSKVPYALERNAGACVSVFLFLLEGNHFPQRQNYTLKLKIKSIFFVFYEPARL